MRTLYEQYASSLIGYVSGLVGGDRQRAEDIVQETLLRAWRHPEVLENADRSPRAWLFTVARNLVIDAHRAQSARPSEMAHEFDDDTGSTDGGLDTALTRYELLEAMESLSQPHRSALILVFYQGHSVAEAAEILGVPPGTVKSRCHYALRSLRVLMQERGLLS